MHASIQGLNAITEAVEAGNAVILQILRGHASYNCNLEDDSKVLLTLAFTSVIAVCTVLGHLVSALSAALPQSQFTICLAVCSVTCVCRLFCA